VGHPGVVSALLLSLLAHGAPRHYAQRLGWKGLCWMDGWIDPPNTMEKSPKYQNHGVKLVKHSKTPFLYGIWMV